MNATEELGALARLLKELEALNTAIRERDEAREKASLFLAQLHVRGIEGIGWRKVGWLRQNSPPDPAEAKAWAVLEAMRRRGQDGDDRR